MPKYCCAPNCPITRGRLSEDNRLVRFYKRASNRVPGVPEATQSQACLCLRRRPHPCPWAQLSGHLALCTW
uniref:THAP domain containing 8 n=1 Tax=Rousettus aegyptiacus TaxID=9407 RepID=A0A7J8CMB8_ROUAE|nr:THAP domain containing 8 [Rousettus aegyptiacus]